MSFLRIQHADKTDLTAMALQQIQATDGKISVFTKWKSYGLLVKSFSGLLESFRASLDKLEERLIAGVLSFGRERMGCGAC